MTNIVNIYEIIGISPSDTTDASDLLGHWRKAAQKWHPEKLSALEARFPLKSTTELKAMAEGKIRALTSIKDLVKELSGNPAKKFAYDQLLAEQNPPPSSASRSGPADRERPDSEGAPHFKTESSDPFNKSSTGHETIIPSDLRGSGIHNYQGDVRIRGDIRGSVVLNVQGNLVVEGDLQGSCVVNARNITVKGDLSGSPVINASGKVTIKGDRSGSAVVNASAGVVVHGDDRSQGGGHGGSNVHINTGGAAFVGGRAYGVSAGPGGVHVGGRSFDSAGSFSTDGSLSIMNGVTSTSGATRTTIGNGKDVLQILGADINRNGTVYGGRVILNGRDVPQNIPGGVDLSKLDSPIAAQFKSENRGGPRPGNW